MNRNGNLYTFIYASVMVIIVAAILSFTAISLKPFQKRNIKNEKKQNILSSVKVNTTVENAESVYDEKIVNTYLVNFKGEKVDGDAFKVDLKKERSKPAEERLLPVFEAKLDGGVKYVIPMYGSGLWGPIWGYLALEDDMNTIFGAVFDHAGETPGLGAEIKTQAFVDPFAGKKIFSNTGELVSLVVAKKGEKAPEQHKVDAISGGTITSKGLEKMLLDDLTCYKQFFNKKK